jgi:hypothetical protein
VFSVCFVWQIGFSVGQQLFIGMPAWRQWVMSGIMLVVGQVRSWVRFGPYGQTTTAVLHCRMGRLANQNDPYGKPLNAR